MPEPEGEIIRRRVRIVAATPSLRGIARDNPTQQLIAQTLIDGGTPPVEAHAAAAAAMGAMTVALFEWATQPQLALADAVHTVLDVLEGRS